MILPGQGFWSLGYQELGRIQQPENHHPTHV